MRELGRSAGSHIRKSHNWKHIPYGNNSIRSGTNANLPKLNVIKCLLGCTLV